MSALLWTELIGLSAQALKEGKDNPEQSSSTTARNVNAASKAAEVKSEEEAVRFRFLMDAHRCTMVTVSQACEEPPESGEAAPGTRPADLELFTRMKQLLAHGDGAPELYGPLPQDNPHLAVFAAPEQDKGVPPADRLPMPTLSRSRVPAIRTLRARLPLCGAVPVTRACRWPGAAGRRRAGGGRLRARERRWNLGAQLGAERRGLEAGRPEEAEALEVARPEEEVTRASLLVLNRWFIP